MSDQPSTSAERFLFPEEGILRGDFKHYFLTKRFNFIATLNNHRDLSDLFLHIDQDWLEAITDLSQIHNPEWIVPGQLTIFCFRELRLAAEMLLSGCTTPGFSHLRSALELFVQAQKICGNQHLGWSGFVGTMTRKSTTSISRPTLKPIYFRRHPDFRIFMGSGRCFATLALTQASPR